MRGVYTAKYEFSLSGAQSVMTVEVPADMCCEILEVHVTETDIDNHEQFEFSLDRITTKGSLAGTSVTPTPMEAGDAASTLTVLGNISVEPTTYGAVIDHQGFSNLAGYHFEPVPEARPMVSPSALVGLQCLVAPSTAHNISVVMTLREIGG